jgi:hypothetical protein
MRTPRETIASSQMTADQPFGGRSLSILNMAGPPNAAD